MVTLPAHQPVPATLPYEEYGEITGPLTEPVADEQPVRYRSIMSSRERIVLWLLIHFNMLASLAFIVWLLLPSHFPTSQSRSGLIWVVIGAAGALLLAAIELVRLLQNRTIRIWAWRMRDPIPVRPRPGMRVAVLTTIVPAKEGVEIMERTLRAMKQIRYDGVFDVWILDEGDDPNVRRIAAELGVRHFTRHGRPEYNQPSGPYRARTKAGNHNAWRAEHEHEYDLVAQMDTDHVPFPHFLERTLGYFRDPDVAFVVAPQVYGNESDSFVALGASDQSHIFEGVVQRGANGLGAPLLIGTNHVYRTAAWSQIGGYQDSIIEDHLTSLTILSTHNPVTGNIWRGVYTPDVLAVGEGPRYWSDYFNQQRRWAYGIWEVILQRGGAMTARLPLRTRLSYLANESFYPGLAFIWLSGNVLTALYLVFGITTIRVNGGPWIALWGTTVIGQFILFTWLRRFNLIKSWQGGTGLVGMVLSLAAIPVYSAAAVTAVLRRPLTYAITAKGSSATRDTWAAFYLHQRWFVTILLLLVGSMVMGNDYLPLRAWGFVSLAIVGFPMVMFLVERRRAVAQSAGKPVSLWVRVGIPAMATLLLVGSFTAMQLISGPGLGGITEPQNGGGGAEPTVAVVSPSPVPRVALPGDVGIPPMYGFFDPMGQVRSGPIEHVYFQWQATPEQLAAAVRAAAERGAPTIIS